MTASIIDGKAIAQQIQDQLRQRVEHITQQVGRAPGLAVVMVGDHPASAAYVRNKEKACARLGIASFGQKFEADISPEQVQKTIDQLNQDDRVDGILVQLPLPEGFNSVGLLLQIDPDKDVDGLHPVNLGRLVRGEPGLRSCTPAGVMRLLQEIHQDLSGKQAVVVGRSLLVGKPVSLMLLEQNATVTMAHSRTPDLGAITRVADVLVVAVGKPQLIRGDMIKPGAAVIDVGINRVFSYAGKGQLIGDVEFESAKEVAGAITPVPGGVGPMTVTLLMHNTISSFCRRCGISGEVLLEPMI